ncbi:MAG: glycosyltransferase family 4 protein [Candidatus Berkelbacteria bacterium]
MKTKTTLVFVHPHFTVPGGAGKMILELGKRLSNDYKIVMIAQSVNDEYRKNYPEITFDDLGGPITDSFRFWLQLSRWRKRTHLAIDKYYKQGHIELISSVFPSNWLALSYKKKRPDVKTFWFCQEPSAFIHIKKWRNAIQSPIKRFIANTMAPMFAVYDKKITRFANTIFSNSEFSRRNIGQVYGRDSIIVYPGIDSKKFHPVDFGAKENYILTVGRLSKFKNINTLVTAISELKNKEVKLKIVGDGEEKSSLIKLARELKISSRVEILSGLSDSQVADAYAKAKVFVLCSKEEPFGMVPVEAMASGTMAIADNSGGPKEIIDNEVNGILIDHMTSGKLAGVLDDLFANQDKIKLFSSKTKEKVDRLFDWSVSAKKLKQILK